MNTYPTALLIHILALLAAIAAGAIVHFAGSRRLHAATAAEALQWHRVAGATERVFPIAVLVLLATGAWMIHDAGALSWSLGWIIAGIVGVIVLMVDGATIGARSRRERVHLEKTGSHAPAPSADRAVHVLGWTNSGVALAVVCDMCLKPTLAPALIVLLVGAAAGALLARRELSASERAGNAKGAEQAAA